MPFMPLAILVIHEFTDDMVEHKEKIVTRPGIAITFHVDGFGSRPGKLSKYSLLSKRGRNCFWGLKLFYRQDVGLACTRRSLKSEGTAGFGHLSVRGAWACSVLSQLREKKNP